MVWGGIKWNLTGMAKEMQALPYRILRLRRMKIYML